MKRYLSVSWSVVFVLVVVGVALAGCASELAEPTQAENAPVPEVVAGADGATLLQDRCSTCHGLDRIASERNSAGAWERVVTEMIGKGAQLTSEEQAILVEYLAANYGG